MRYQHEPVVSPREWIGDEKRFVQRIEKLFDDLYTKFGKLREDVDSGGGAEPYVLPVASDTTLGGVMIGENVSITDGVLSADEQTENDFTDTLKDKLDGIEAGANNYSLPTAGANTKGGIKVGAGLTMTGDVLSAEEQTPADMSGADGANPGTHGLVPAPAATDNTKFLKGDGTWGTPSSGGDSSAVLLWENSAPTTAFAEQDVTVDLSGYDGAIIEYSPYTTYPTPIRSRAIAIGDGDPLMAAGIHENYFGGRYCTVMRDKVKFWRGYNHSTSTANSLSIPLAIYGVKGGVHTPATQEQNCTYLVRRFDPYGGVVKGFSASKTIGNADALFCEWAYRLGGVGFALQTSTSSNSTLIGISDESFTVAAGSRLEIDVAYHGYTGYNWIGLIQSSDVPSGFPNYRPASTTALQNLFTVKSSLSATDNTFMRTTVSMTVTSAGTYHLAYCKANQTGGIDMGTYTILEARLFAS